MTFAPLRFLIALLLCLTPVLAAAQSQTYAAVPDVVLVYEGGAQKTDRSFIEMARTGLLKARDDFGATFAMAKVQDSTVRKSVIEEAAKNGTPLIITLGFQNVAPVMQLAEEYPDTQFTVIDGAVPPLFPNVQSILFKDHEGAFLIGLIAAKRTSSNIIGFVGGMDVPVIRNFAHGFKQGAHYADPHVRVLTDMIGNTRAAWSNPLRAGKLAEHQFNQGADIIFAAAGGSSLGVLQAARQHDKYAIGVDTNQNSIYPGNVLTSLVKRVDKAVHDTIKQAREATWQPGTKYLGLKEGALDYALDMNNKDLISKDIIESAEEARDLIIQGLIKVDSYQPQ